MTRRTIALATSLAALALAGERARAQREAPDTVRVCAGGDVTLGALGDTVKKGKRRIPPPSWPAPDSLIAPLVPLFADADVVMVNVEGAIGTRPAEKCPVASKHCYALRTPAAAAAAIRGMNESAAVVGNVANNHSRDAGEEGFAETLLLLRDAGVWVTGADSEPTIVVTARGDTVAFLGFSPYPPMDALDLDLVRRLVARAAAITPRVVVTMHLGAEGPKAQRTRDVSEKYVGEERGDPIAFARAAIESGAKLVIGHGPHVVRGVAWSNGALVLYSLGNLVTAGPFSLSPPNDRGLIVCADLGPDGRVVRGMLRPTRQRAPGVVASDPSARAIVLADSLARLDFRDSAAKLRVQAEILPP